MRWSTNSEDEVLPGERGAPVVQGMTFASSERRSFVENSEMLEKVGCAGVIAIEVEYFVKQTLRFGRAAQTSQGLRAKIQCIDLTALREVLIEQQHGREGRGEVVDLRLSPFKL